MIIERHNVVAQKAVMPKKMPKHKKIVVEDDIQVHLGELIYAWKKVRLKSRLGSNLTFFTGSVNLHFLPGSNLEIS